MVSRKLAFFAWVILPILFILTVSETLAQSEQQETGTTAPTTVGEERREERQTITRTAPADRGGALLPPWSLVIEPSFEYDHFSGQNVSISGFTIFQAILIGRVAVEKVKRDIFIPAMTVRLGIKRAELNVKVPYLFRTDKIITPRSGAGTGELVEKNYSDSYLGDIETYLYYQLFREGRLRPWVPDVILRFGGKFPTGRDPYGLNREFDQDIGAFVATEFPTGTGHWGFSLGSTFIKSADPAIVFLNVAYYWNFPRFVGTVNDLNFGSIDLGDSLEWNIGLIMAIQERLSLNFSYNQRITGRTLQNGTPLTDTSINNISFKIGATYVFSPRFTLDFVVGLGLSEDAPDVSVLVRLPVTLQFTPKRLRSPTKG